jgi:outer membrane immunogenic protein
MKHLGLAALAAALISSGAAHGADINGSLKDSGDVFSAPKEVNWTGFYIQGHGGYGNANHNLSVQDYFKDYCADKGDTSVGFDEDGDLDGSAWKTVENKKEAWPTITGDTCENLAKTEGTGKKFSAGSHVTVPGDSREIGSIDGINSHGGIGGGRVGFDWARGKILFGVFGEYNFTNMKTEASIAGVGNFGLEKDDEWSVGGRIGYVVAPRTLLYVLAAYTQTEYNLTGLNAINFGDASVKSGATFDGISVGGGIEFALTNNVFLGMEYAHTFYGEEDILNVYSASANQGIKVVDDLDEDKILGTLKIKLNGGLFD